MANLSSGAPQGYIPKKKGVLDVLHKRRRMKTYTVTELELDTVSNLNSGCTFAIGMASLFIGSGLGFVAARVALDMNTAPAGAKLLFGFPGMALVFGLGLGFAIYAGVCYFRSGGMTETIKKESEDEVQT